MLLICCTLASVSCAATPEPKTVMVPVSVNCKGGDCIAVTRTYVNEHTQLMVDNIRLKAQNARCHEPAQ